MKSNQLAEDGLAHPRVRSAFRTIRLLTGGYLAISVLSLLVIALLRDDAADVNPTVWIRGSIVAASAVLTFALGAAAARGSSSSYLRLRIISAVMIVAVVAVISDPGLIPVWMKIEQGVCGLLLLGVAVIVNGPRLRAFFAAQRSVRNQVRSSST